jgi:hypothetical protein
VIGLDGKPVPPPAQQPAVDPEAPKRYTDESAVAHRVPGMPVPDGLQSIIARLWRWKSIWRQLANVLKQSTAEEWDGEVTLRIPLRGGRHLEPRVAVHRDYPRP